MAAGGIAVVAALGLAVPAVAEPLSGTYTATIGDGATMTQTWVFTPCGADCTSLDIGGGAPAKEMRLQGNTWSWTQTSDGVPCTTTIDAASLAGMTGCGGMTFPVRLSR
ncbi:hypothetical protein BHQ18_24310 [Mycolicibacterium flavescens]|uniref:Secreted protein n=1 Tax=Mycolicibacterium flavescens TaxID=1776 RepID=A0A1E3RBL4_MYCFV|nr:hypothetical protein BHQ18_24310 [Mycolicibacterium flavescens]